MSFSIVTGIQAIRGTLDPQQSFTTAQKRALAVDIFLVASAAIAATLVFLSNQGIPLGQLSGIGSLGAKSVYMFAGIGAGFVLADLIVLGVQFFNKWQRLQKQKAELEATVAELNGKILSPEDLQTKKDAILTKNTELEKLNKDATAKQEGLDKIKADAKREKQDSSQHFESKRVNEIDITATSDAIDGVKIEASESDNKSVVHQETNTVLETEIKAQKTDRTIVVTTANQPIATSTDNTKLQSYKLFTREEFNQSSLMPDLPIEIVANICSFLHSSDASVLSCLSRNWNFFVTQGDGYFNQGEQALMKQIRKTSRPSNSSIVFGGRFKRFSHLTTLGLTLEYNLYMRNKKEDFFTPFLIELNAMIGEWGRVRLIVKDSEVEDNEWRFVVVDFRQPIILKTGFPKEPDPQFGFNRGTPNPTYPFHDLGKIGSKWILSQKRIGFCLSMLTNASILPYAQYIDDQRVKTLAHEIEQLELNEKKEEAYQLRRSCLNFHWEDCARFTLQLIKNKGKELLLNGYWIEGDYSKYADFTIQEIINDTKTQQRVLTYLDE
jgi:hypothetical protein